MSNLPDHSQWIAPRGSVCPQCNGVMAPAMMWCIHCKPKENVTTPSTIKPCKHLKFGCFECTTVNLSEKENKNAT